LNDRSGIEGEADHDHSEKMKKPMMSQWRAPDRRGRRVFSSWNEEKGRGRLEGGGMKTIEDSSPGGY